MLLGSEAWSIPVNGPRFCRRAPGQMAWCAPSVGWAPITSEIISQDVSVPQNRVRLVDERRYTTGLLIGNRTEIDNAIHGDCEGRHEQRSRRDAEYRVADGDGQVQRRNGEGRRDAGRRGPASDLEGCAHQ